MEALFVAIGIARRRLRLLLLLFLVLLIGGMAGVYLKRPAYESSAKLLVNLEGLAVSLSQADIPQSGPQIQAVEAITSQVELLTSRQLMESVVDKLGVEAFRSPPPGNPVVRFLVGTVDGLMRMTAGALERIGLIERIGERDAIVEALSAGLKVYPVRQSQIIVVSLRWRNPSVPPLALATLLDLFVAKTEAIDTKQSEYGVFTEQVKVASDALGKAENDLRSFQKHYDIVDLAREKQMLIERIDRLTAAGVGLGLAGDEAGDATPQPVAIESGGKDGGGTEQIGELRSKLNALNVERAKAALTYTADNRAVRELDRQIEATQAVLDGEIGRQRNLVLAARERLRTLRDAEQPYNAILRNIDIATQAYQTYRKVAADRAVMLAHETKVHIQVIDAPDAPLRATGPSRLVWALVAAIFALVASALLVFAVDMLRRRRGPAVA